MSLLFYVIVAIALQTLVLYCMHLEKGKWERWPPSFCRDGHSDSLEEKDNTTFHASGNKSQIELFMGPCVTKALAPTHFFSFTLEAPLFWIKPTVIRLDHMLPAITAKNVAKVGGARQNLFYQGCYIVQHEPMIDLWLGVFDMPNSDRYNILLISIFCKIVDILA